MLRGTQKSQTEFDGGPVCWACPVPLVDCVFATVDQQPQVERWGWLKTKRRHPGDPRGEDQEAGINATWELLQQPRASKRGTADRRPTIKKGFGGQRSGRPVIRS